MDFKPSRRLLMRIGIAACFLLLVPSNVIAAGPPVTPTEMRGDAELHDVCFLDTQRGWAVGDRGVILTTQDGGRHWSEQTSGTTAILRSVHFIDARRGWIVGGYIEPFRDATQAVILRTEDGGRRWTLQPAKTLPALRRVKMLDAQNGWAVGESSPLYPSGVFRTEDGGRHWSTVPAGRANGLLTGDFTGRSRAVVAGREGQLQLVLGDETVPTRTPDLGRRPLRALRMSDPQHGWLVGADGLILSTRDGGLSWRMTAAASNAEQFDFHACATLGAHVWVAGDPGGLVFRSSDGGGAWEAFPTPVSTPLKALHFATPSEGWAAGALGVILHTRDGGKTWQVQRQGGERLAIWQLAVADDYSLETLASASGGDGYLSRLTVLFPTPRPEEYASLSDRVHEASLAVGGSGGEAAWQFRLPDQDLLVRGEAVQNRIEQLEDGRGGEALEEHLVMRIRQWRPAVIVAPWDASGPFTSLLVSQLQQAVASAADPTRFPDQLTRQGLATHRVARVFLQSPQGQVELSSSRLLTGIGKSVGDLASYSRALLQSDYRVTRETIRYRSLRGAAVRGLFDGLRNLGPGQGARRVSGSPLIANLTQLRQMIQQSRNAREILARSEDPQAALGPEQLLGQLDDLTGKVNEQAAGELNYQLAKSLWQRGQRRLAAQAMERLLTRYPESHYADLAAGWLVRFYSSGEIRAQQQKQSSIVAASGEIRTAGATEAVDVTRFEMRDEKVKPAGFRSELDLQQKRIHRPSEVLQQASGRDALHFSQWIQQTRPTLYEDAQLRFAVAAAQRGLGQLRPADGFYRRFSDTDSPPGWREAALAELWLSHKQGQPPKPIQPCFQTSQRPVLDGRLNERMWQAAQPLDLKSDNDAPVEELATRVWLAYDHEHLYLAAVCQSDQTPAASDSPRRRDADLTRHDRLQFCFDLDRDYATYYRLTVDERGWGGEDLFGDTTWNPGWKIAHTSMHRLWIVEAAIPLRDLVGEAATKTPLEGQTWSFGVQRVTPDRALQSWSQPAAVQTRPEGFGLLNFVGER